MLSKLFYTPVLRGRIEPSKHQLDETNAVLDAYWERAEEGVVMLETGRSTASVRGGKCLWDHTEFDWFLNPVMIAAHKYWKDVLQLRKTGTSMLIACGQINTGIMIQQESIAISVVVVVSHMYR